MRKSNKSVAKYLSKNKSSCNGSAMCLLSKKHWLHLLLFGVFFFYRDKKYIKNGLGESGHVV